MPVYEVPEDLLAAHGARGIEYEPETVGRATGIWDGLAIVTARYKALSAESRRSASMAATPRERRSS